VVRQLLDTQLRILLRGDLALASAERNLTHPQRYTVPVAPDLLSRFVSERIKAFDAEAPRVPDGVSRLARVIAADAAELGRSTLFVLLPIHPRLLAWNPERMRAAQRDFEQALVDAPGARVLDVSMLLDAGDFIDDLHPTNAGAAKLTRVVADALRRVD